MTHSSHHVSENVAESDLNLKSQDVIESDIVDESMRNDTTNQLIDDDNEPNDQQDDLPNEPVISETPSNVSPESKANPPEIKIDPEFAKLLPPLTGVERELLERNLVDAGECRDSIVVWQEEGFVLDGHNRFEICTEHDLPYPVSHVSLPDREAAETWIMANQLGKRNLTPEKSSYLRGKLYQALKKRQGGNRKNELSSAQNEHLKTAEELAAKHHVSPSTIRRDEAFAADVDTIEKNCGDEAKQILLSPDTKIPRTKVKEIADLEPEDQKQALQEVVQLAKQPKTAAKKAAGRSSKRGSSQVPPQAVSVDEPKLDDELKDENEADLSVVAQEQRDHDSKGDGEVIGALIWTRDTDLMEMARRVVALIGRKQAREFVDRLDQALLEQHQSAK